MKCEYCGKDFMHPSGVHFCHALIVNDPSNPSANFIKVAINAAWNAMGYAPRTLVDDPMDQARADVAANHAVMMERQNAITGQ